MTKEEILAGVIEDLKALKQTWIERAEQNETHNEMVFEGRIGQIQECIDIVISHNGLQSEKERLKAEMEWISVETKLPKFDELVIWRGLVTWNSKNPIRIFSDEMTTDQETLEYGEQAYLLKNETDYVVCRNPNVQEFTDQFVTHWMPFPELPQPPKK